MRIHTRTFVFGLVAVGVVISFSRDAGSQASVEDVVDEAAEILLEDLSPDEQVAILDDLSQDMAEADGITAWADASQQLADYAEYQISVREAGVDLSVGVEP